MNPAETNDNLDPPPWESGIEDFYTLTPMQQGMLYQTLYAPEAGSYTRQVLCELLEALNVSAFRKAWRHILARHPILRTTVQWVGLPEPVHRIHKRVCVHLQEQDWQALPASEQRRRLEEYARLERQKPFDLTSAPPIRLALIRFGPADYRFIWTFHHILSDKYSDVLLLRELFSYYDAFCNGEERPVEQAASFKEQSEWLKTQDLEKAESYWRSYLRGVARPTPLPMAAPPKEHFDPHAHAVYYSEMPVDLKASLSQLAEKQNCTLGVLLQTAFSILLSRYTGEEQVVFGGVRRCRRSTLDGRKGDTIAGPFLNTVPVCARISRSMSALALMRELRRQWTELREYEHTPLAKIHEWSEAPKGVQLFEMILLFDKAEIDWRLRSQGGDWEHRRVHNIQALTHYALTLSWFEEPVLSVLVNFLRDRFDAAGMARMAGHLQRLLELFVEDPTRPISTLSYLTRSEQEQILVEWNNTRAEYPDEVCADDLFAVQAKNRPDGIAVVDSRQHLSYAKLNERANKLGHYLQERGIGPESLVALCMERGAEMVIAMVGALKAGGAYLPLDCEYPKERLEFILEDAGVHLVLCQDTVVGRLPARIPAAVCLDRDWEQIEPYCEQSPKISAVSDNLAYVIYTSGSTGKPKGVEISRRNLANLIAWHQRAYEVTARDRASQQAGIAFDASVWELWPYLTAGASILMPNKETRNSYYRLMDWICNERITICFLSTPIAEALIREQWPSGISLKTMLTGGDRLQSRPEANLPFSLVNHYGPTENTVVASRALVGYSSDPQSPPPIGEPISNVEIYILDGHSKPAPVGIVGELHIAGKSLARGYRGQGGLTAEKFIPHPFTGEAGSRMYKSGDMGRYLADGKIDFRGRNDFQVKVRGFRVELGEIEAALSEHPQVAQAVVLARQDVGNETQLVAYLTRRGERRVEPEELRSYLERRLPGYMTPSFVIELAQMPLTSNGKLDRNALPAPKPSNSQAESALTKPRSAVQETLATIFEQALGLERIGLEDNFFDLGGHSLKAIRLISRIRETFGVELPWRRLFEEPTVARLTHWVEDCIGGLPAPPISRAPRKGGMPLSYAQERLWFLNQLIRDNPVYNIARVVRLTGRLCIGALQKSFSSMCSRHEALRTSFRVENEEAAQVVREAEPVKLPLVDLCGLKKAGVVALELAREEARRSFDLIRGPLFRVTLFRLSKRKYVLLLGMHHIVSDYWSINVLWRELADLYEAFRTGKPSPLQELEFQYVDFALWQRELLGMGLLQNQLNYWKGQLHGLTPLELPTDRIRPAIVSYRGASHNFQLPAELVQKLRGVSRQEGVTLFMTLLAAFQLLLARYSGQQQIAVGTPIAGRNRKETEELIGFFANTLVIRADLRGNPTVREWLKRVREVALSAYAHQDLPFEKLVEELQPERSLSHHPLFQVMFSFQNTAPETLTLSGLKVAIETVKRDTAKFDLTLSLAEKQETIEGFVEYATDLFDKSTVERLAGRLQRALEEMVANMEGRVMDLPLLTEREWRQLVGDWNDTAVEYTADERVGELFEAQVKRTPEAIAVVCGGEHVSYAELNRRADRLAGELSKKRVGLDDRVGVCMDKSADMVIALLGAMKSGGAYLPLDPTYPREWLRYVLDDSDATILITERKYAGRIGGARSEIVLDREWEQLRERSEEKVENGATAENLAYVIYTSGSTGLPKGVMVSHSAVRNRILWGQSVYPMTGEDSVLQIASLGFDFSVWEILAPLVVGAKLVMLRIDGHLDSVDLIKAIATEMINVIHFVPSMLRIFLNEEGLESCRRLRLVFSGGEPLTVELQERFFAHFDGELYNQYGPTEATIDATYWKCSHRPSQWHVPIGRPIANGQVYLLDGRMQPVPIGARGELHISGAGLARGYVGRPEITGLQFLPNPFNGRPGERMYRTGDLGRHLPDGNLDYLGRRDYQVKIRGFRIELGEIETVLNQHSAVEKAMVMAREDQPGDRRLVAYLVGNQEITERELREYLKRKLPNYMTPSAFVQMPEMPLTRNGKVDRRALPEPDGGAADDWNCVSPRSPAEEVIAANWQELLALDKVGVFDNFFDLGGHSLLALRLVSRLRSAFQIEMSVNTIFEAPTVAQLAIAVAIEKAKAASEGHLASLLDGLERIQEPSAHQNQTTGL